MNPSKPGKGIQGAIPGAILIAALWGFNFVVIKVGVAQVPPLLLAALRFIFSAFPAVLFIKRPAVPWTSLAAYGLFLGVGEFGLLFSAIKLGAPAGLASILLQSQAFFTAILASLLHKERLARASLLGMAFGALGLGIIAFSGRTGAPLAPYLVGMVLLAALGWAAANLVVRSLPATGGLGLMAWSSLFSPLPLLGLSLAFEGPGQILASLGSLSPLSIGALAYLVILSTLVGYGLWNHLIRTHGAVAIAPFSLLVPVFSLASTALFLGERLPSQDLIGAALVLLGLLVHVLGKKLGLDG